MKYIAHTLGIALLAMSGIAATYAATTFTDQGIFDQWFSSAAMTMNQHGIVQGYADGSFKPKNNVTRAELVVMLDRFADAIGHPLEAEGSACTEELIYGISLMVVDTKGNHVTDLAIQGLGRNGFVYTFEDTPRGYVGLAEEESGYYDVRIDDERFAPFERTYRLERDNCHVIQIKDTIVVVPANEDAGGYMFEQEESADEPTPEPVVTNFDPLHNLQETSLPTTHLLDVPFTAQAPYGDWSVPYNEACEEASMLMVDAYLSAEQLPPTEADRRIVDFVEWQTAMEYAVDIGAFDVQSMGYDYFQRQAMTYTGADVTKENIKKLLAAGHPVIVPTAGQDLGNPHYLGSGPPYHMIVIIGYDETHFITHDPGTSRGEAYRYEQNLLVDAIHDWTGQKSTVSSGQKAMTIYGGMIDLD